MRAATIFTAAVVATGASASLQNLQIRQTDLIAGCETQCSGKLAWLQQCQADPTNCFATCTDVTDLEPCTNCAKEKKPDQASQLDALMSQFKNNCKAQGNDASASGSASGSGAAASGASATEGAASAASSAASVAGSATSAAASAASSAAHSGGVQLAASYGPVGVAVSALVAGAAAIFIL